MRAGGQSVEHRVGGARVELVPAHMRDLEAGLAESAGSMATTSPPIQPRPSTVSNSRPRSAISCMPTQMPRNGRAARHHRLDERGFEPGRRRQDRGGNRQRRPDPGGGRCGRRRRRCSAGWSRRCRPAMPFSAAARSNAFAAELQIAGAVVEDRNVHRSGLRYYRLPPSVPLVDGTAPPRRGSISTACRRKARASPLKQDFRRCGGCFRRTQVFDVEGQPGRLGEGLEPLLEQLGVHLAELGPADSALTFHIQIRAVRRVEADAGQRFVHRDRRRCRSAWMPARSPSAFDTASPIT